MPSFEVTAGTHGQVWTVPVEADSFFVDTMGNLIMTRDANDVHIFAGGVWRSVIEVTPNKYTEATRAAS